MADITPLMAQVFGDELTKIAFSPAGLLSSAGKFVSRQGSTIGGMAGMGGLIGAGGGAALGGYKGYRQAREQGAGVGSSLLHGAGKSLGGAVKGGLIGAAAGGIAGGVGGQEATKLVQDVGARAAASAAAGGKPGLLAGASRFGQRQMYGLTGALPQGPGSAIARARSIGAGAADQAERYAKAKAGVSALKAPGAEMPKTFFGRQLGAEEAMAKAQTELSQARKGYQEAMKMERLGATNVPGYAKAMWKDPLATLKHGIGEQWHGSGVGGKALMFGVPAAFAAHEVVKTPQAGESRMGNIGKAVGGAAIGLTPVPLLGMMALGTAGSEIGGAAGNVLNRGARAVGIRHRGLMGALPAREQHPYTLAGDQGGGQVEAAGGNFAAPEYYYSNSAKGQGPEGWS